MSIYKKYIKRCIDFLCAMILLPFLVIATVVIGPMIFIEDKGSIIYTAKRRGIHGKIFKMYKFRSMKMNAPDLRNADNSTYNAPDDPRITKIGKILRSTSLDELPQIINILKGDMSFIGPRPITINKPIEEYDDKRRIRLLVRPGLTGYTQAYYRNSISQEEKLQLDAEYAKNVTFVGDVRILFQSVKTVFQRKNIYIENQNQQELYVVKNEVTK